MVPLPLVTEFLALTLSYNVSIIVLVLLAANTLLGAPLTSIARLHRLGVFVKVRVLISLLGRGWFEVG